MEKVEGDERCVVAGDLNGHVGQRNDVISCIHGDMGMEKEMRKAI